MVAEELHFARAAERLGMEQSPLSQSIRKLEDQIGTKLLHRTTRKTRLTLAGEGFYQEAKRIIRDVDALAAGARRSSSALPEIVRVVLAEDLASEPFTRLISKLDQRQPRTELIVRELAHVDAARLLRDGGADVVVTLNPRDEPQLNRERAWSEPLMVVVPAKHQLGERGQISLRDLSGETLALPTADECPGYVAQVEALLKRHNVQLSGRRDVKHWNTGISFAATGLALGLAPRSMLHATDQVGLLALEEVDAVLVTWLLYRGDEPSSAVSLVLEIAADVASSARAALPNRLP